MTYYLSGALASQNSASINQAITGALPLSDNDFVTTWKDNLSFDISPSGEYMLKATFMGTGSFASSPGNDYDPGIIIYQSGSINGFEQAGFVRNKGSRALDSALTYADLNNMFNAQFLSDGVIVWAGGSYDPQDGTSTRTDGIFGIITGSGTNWGLHKVLSGSTQAGTAQSRDDNLGAESDIGDFNKTDAHGLLIAANNKYNDTLATRVAVYNGLGHASPNHPQGYITIFQQSGGDWSFHSQFNQLDIDDYINGSFSSAMSVHDMTWIDENNLVVVYYSDSSTDYSFTFAFTFNASTSKWEVSGYDGSAMSNYAYRLTRGHSNPHVTTSGTQGIRFVEYDPFSERLLMGYQGDSIWMFQSQSNWLRDDLYGNSLGKGTPSEEEDHGHAGSSGSPPFGNKNRMRFAFADGRTTIVGIESDGYGENGNSPSKGANTSLVYHESSSASGWNDYSIAAASGVYQGKMRKEYFSTGSLTLAAEAKTGWGIAPYIYAKGSTDTAGMKTAFTMNSRNGGSGNIFAYHEADPDSTGGSSQRDTQRLLIGNFGAFPAANPALESTVTQTVGTSGGTVKAGGTEGTPTVTLTFPEDALAGNTSIGIDLTLNNDPKLNGLGDAGVAGADVYSNRISLTPHGTTFASAVTVQFSLHGDGAGSCPTNLEIWKRQNDSGIWYLVPNNLWSCSSGTITISTTSFSEYMAIGGNNMARTKISNVQLNKLTESDRVLAEAINISGSLLAGEVSSVVAGDYFLIQQAAGGTARPVSASVMQDFFSKSDVHASVANADQKILFASGSGNGVSVAVDDGTGLTFNASTNLLKAGALTVANTISGSIVSAAGLVSAGGSITAGDSITAANTVSGSLLVAAGSVTAGTSFVIGSADLNETDLEKLDGITNGAGAANKALVLDAGADIVSGLRNLSASGGIVAGLVSGSGVGSFASLDIDSGIAAGTSITAGTSFIIGSADLNETDLEKLDGITNGAGAANKALVLDAGADIVSGLRNLSASGGIVAGLVSGSGVGSFASLDIDSGIVAGTSVTAGTSFIIGSADLNETDLEKLDGITNGAGAANKALVLDAGADIVSGLRNLSASGGIVAGLVSGSGVGSFASLDIDGVIAAGSSVTAGTSFIIGSADLNEADLEKLDGITNGTAAASKAVVLDANKNVGTLNSLTASGVSVTELAATNATIAGNLTVQGTTTTVDSEHLTVKDTIITLGSSSSGDSPGLGDRGFVFEVTGSQKAFFWDQSATEFALAQVPVGQYAHTGSGDINIDSYLDLSVGAVSGSGAGSFASLDIDGVVAAGGSITAGTSFVIGSADLNETDLEKLDGITNGAGAANKALVLDAGADVVSGLRNLSASGGIVAATVSGSGQGSFENLSLGGGTATVSNTGVASFGGTVTAVGSFIIGSADLNEADMEKLDGITNGTGAASKALVLDANKNITGINSVTSSFSGDGSGLTGVGAEVKLAGADDLDLQIPFTTGSASAGTFFIDSGSLTFNPNSNKLTVAGAVSGSGAGSFASLDIDGVVAAGASVTAGTSFIIGSADLDETDLEKLDGITNGAGAANKALVLDAGADVVSGLRNLSASGGIVAATVSGSGAGSFDSLDIDSAIAAGTSITAGTSFIIGSADLNETDLEKLDGITNGAGAANKALVLDAGADIVSGLRNLSASALVGVTVSGSGQGSFENLSLGGGTTTVSNTGVASFGGTVTAVGSFIIGSADLNEADLEKLDGITNGTAAASKAVVLDASLNATGVNALTASGLKASTALDATGTIHLHAASASVAVASDFMYFKEADGTNEVKQQTVAGFLSASTGAGLQITNGVFSVVSVTDIATSASKNSILSADLVTASLTTDPLTGSIQVYLNGLLQTPSGSVNTGTEGEAATTALFDYEVLGAPTAFRVEFVSAIDDDDVVQVKYIKR